MCGQNADWLCSECFNRIKSLPTQLCPYCEKNITDSGSICPYCREKFLSKNAPIPLDNLVVAASYRENAISHLVHMYKYNFVRGLSVPLGQIITEAILKNNLPLPDLIIPVPLHPRRERWRGFNQSELLADHVSQNLTPGMAIPVANNLILRARYTKPQMKIKNYQERQKNIKDIFKINPSRDNGGSTSSGRFGRERLNLQTVGNKTILLVDDIATTGSTLFECGKILKKNGAKKVMGAVIARQEV